MALISLLPEAAFSHLVNQVDKTKRRLEAVGKNNLDIALVYCRTRYWLPSRKLSLRRRYPRCAANRRVESSVYKCRFPLRKNFAFQEG